MCLGDLKNKIFELYETKTKMLDKLEQLKDIYSSICAGFICGIDTFYDLASIECMIEFHEYEILSLEIDIEYVERIISLSSCVEFI